MKFQYAAGYFRLAAYFFGLDTLFLAYIPEKRGNTAMELIFRIRYILWGPFTVLLILGTGAYLTWQSKFVQVWCLPRLLCYSRQDKTTGGLSPWQALCTSLGGTLGVGNLAGVAAAITFGGPEIGRAHV